MVQAKRKKVSSWGRVWDVIFFLLIASAVYLTLSFISYHPDDNSWSYQGESQVTLNWGGSLGAWLADGFLQAFGYMAYIFPVVLISIGWRLTGEKANPVLPVLIQFLGLILLIGAGTGLFRLVFATASAGGALGHWISQPLLDELNPVSAQLFLSLLSIVGIGVLFHFSWLSIVDEIGRITLLLLSSLPFWPSAKVATTETKAKRVEPILKPELNSEPALETSNKDKSQAQIPVIPSISQAPSLLEPIVALEKPVVSELKTTECKQAVLSPTNIEFELPDNGIDNTEIKVELDDETAIKSRYKPQKNKDKTQRIKTTPIFTEAPDANGENSDKTAIKSSYKPKKNKRNANAKVAKKPASDLEVFTAEDNTETQATFEDDTAVKSDYSSRKQKSVKSVERENPVSDVLELQHRELPIASKERPSQDAVEIIYPDEMKESHEKSVAVPEKIDIVYPDGIENKATSPLSTRSEVPSATLSPLLDDLDEIEEETNFVFRSRGNVLDNSESSVLADQAEEKSHADDLEPENIVQDDNDEAEDKENVDFEAEPEADLEPVIASVVPPKPKVKKKKAVKQVPKFRVDDEIELPPVNVLEEPASDNQCFSEEELLQMAENIEIKLNDFRIKAEVVEYHPGPVITRFELQLAPGIKAARITTLSRDLARSLSVISVRVVEVIPGKPYIGLEIPNAKREVVYLSELLRSEAYRQASAPMTLALGKDIGGQPYMVNIAKMPHLLVAGTTGSGKSVAVNSMILSLLFKSSPNDVRLIMIDPKMLELSVYEGIPHLLAPVVTNMKEAANSLRWCVVEMDRRYHLMAGLGVRNIAGFNRKVEEAMKQGRPLHDPWAEKEGEVIELEPLPYIVVIVDELADMMMIVGKQVEELIARLAQKARAAGIHLILATQRPSVDVITGLIKANIPTRIAFQVSSRIDSRTILEQTGAESLLGHGDMLYLSPGAGLPVRLHGAFVEDEEVHQVVAFLTAQGQPNYIEEIVSTDSTDDFDEDDVDGADSYDPLFDKAVAFVTTAQRVSISSVQRHLRVGYNRAARIVEEMEEAGIVSPPDGKNSNREVLAPPPPPVDE